MGRIVAYMSNRFDLVATAFHQERDALRFDNPPDIDVGWGLGFYQGDEILHKKRPQTAGDSIDWDALVGDIRSYCVLAHLRQPSVGDFRAENTHPFRMRQWLFAQAGTFPRFSEIKDRWLEAMPDFIRRNIRGDTDAEHFFHLVLWELHQKNELDNRNVNVHTVLTALRDTLQLVDACYGTQTPPLPINWVLTNGRHTFVVRQHLPVSYCVCSCDEEAIDTDADLVTDPSVFGNRRGNEGDPAQYLMAITASPQAPSHSSALQGYKELDANSVLVVDGSLRTEVYPL